MEVTLCNSTGVIAQHDVPFTKNGFFYVTVPIFKPEYRAVKILRVDVDHFDPSILHVVMLLSSPMPHFHAHLNKTIAVKYIVVQEGEQFDFDGSASSAQIVEFTNRCMSEKYYFIVTEIEG